MTFTVVGTLADFGAQPRAGVRVRANATPTVKVAGTTVYSDATETALTDAAGAFTLTLTSLVGLWYTIRTDYGETNPATLAGYIPDTLDPTTGVVLAPGTVIQLADLVTEAPTPGYAVAVGPPGPPGTPGAATAAPGAGALTTGDVVTIGGYATNRRSALTADVGTGLVAGGAPNNENVVGGNLANVDTATSNLTGAAALTAENGNWVFLHGGYDTVVNGWACIVAGFHCKVDVNANHVTIAGGSRHVVAAATIYGTVGGGTLNQISGTNPTVAGGNTNLATANGATVGGGQTNTASAAAATVAGGVGNTASAANATVGGGSTNSATSNSATVVGGLNNTASTGTGATVVGGRDNVATGFYSLASGRGAVAIENGQHAHAQTPFATAGDAQINRWVLKKQTTDATAGNLEADTGAPPVIPVDTTWAFSALVVARRTDVDGDNAAYEVRGCFKRDAGSTAALVGTPTVTALGASAGAATWTVTTGSFSAGTLRLIVTGEAAKTIRWVCELRASQASG